MVRLAALRYAAAKFFKPREKVVTDKAKAVRDFLALTVVSVLVRFGCFFFVWEFAFPTNDLLYDARMLISPEFELFARGGKAALNMPLYNRLRVLHKEEKEEKEAEQGKAYQVSFVDP